MKRLTSIFFASVFVFKAHGTIDASLQMQLGNPSGATGDTNNHSHFLIQRAVEAIDYSDALGEPLWASWDLTAADVGSVTRSPSFYTDTNLPPNFYRVTDNDYNGVGSIGFSRGHLCPSEDRTDTTNDNRQVFYMSNMMPQSGANNSGVWANFESYCRGMLSSNELLITCGPSGFGTNKIPSGKAYIASNTWKVVVCVPLGAGTATNRIGATNRVIAISVPNVTNGLSSSWQTYVTSPLRIEQDTGLRFFTALPSEVAAALRLKRDGKASVPVLSVASYAQNQFKFTVSGSLGSNYVVQATTNLTAGFWAAVMTNVAPFQFVESNTGSMDRRFYRVVGP